MYSSYGNSIKQIVNSNLKQFQMLLRAPPSPIPKDRPAQTVAHDTKGWQAAGYAGLLS